MDTLDAVSYKIDYLRQRIGHTGIEKRFAVVLISSDYPAEALGKTRVAKTDHALDLVCVDDGHDPGNDRNIDACDPASLAEIIEDPVLEKEL